MNKLNVSLAVGVIALLGVVGLWLVGNNQPVPDFGSRTQADWQAKSLTSDSFLTVTGGSGRATTTTAGITEINIRDAVATGSAVGCSVANGSATSSLSAFNLDIHNATGTATIVVEVARGASGSTATTTSLSGGVMSLGAQAHSNFTFVASTTGNGNQPNNFISVNSRWIFAPHERLNVRFGGATGDVYTNYSPVGVCTTQFREMD